MVDTVTDYYQQHADRFFHDTVTVDMASLHARFLARVSTGGHILDAGCGSGRDAKVFKERGYRVTAFDAAPALATLAEAHLEQPVAVLRFQDMVWEDTFDGIWACASLLHVPAAELSDVFHRMVRAIKPHGVLYASFKYGHGEREQDGRRFTDMDEIGLADLLQQVGEFHELETWVSTDRRPGRNNERWLNTLLSAGEVVWAHT